MTACPDGKGSGLPIGDPEFESQGMRDVLGLITHMGCGGAE